jgi:diguanylate cyclase (GGDEF)-like protein/PAS domain S-box-containing protein
VVVMDALIPSRAQQWRRLPIAAQVGLVALSVLLLGSAAVLLRPADSAVAMWWPAAGVAVAAMILTAPRHRPMIAGAIFAASILSNVLGGRAWLVAVLFALGNTAEAVVVLWIMAMRRRDPGRLEQPEDVARLLLAVVAGGLTAGVIAGSAAAWLLGSGFGTTLMAVTASHVSAIMLLLPMALHGGHGPTEAGRVELVAQWLLVAGVTLAVFAPGQPQALAFLIIPALLWGAMRSSLVTVSVQLLTVGLIATGASLQGAGPFVLSATSSTVTVSLVQVLIVTCAVVALGVVVTVDQRRDALQDMTRREELFRSGFSGSLLGAALLEVESGQLRILELNGVAARMLGGDAAHLVGGPFCGWMQPEDRTMLVAIVEQIVAGERDGWHGELLVADERAQRWFELAIAPAPTDGTNGHLLTVQMIDVTARREADARLTDLALRDVLTGLANRVLLGDRLEQALADARRTGATLGVFFIDLDGFKAINDTFGHAVGDRVLQQVTRQLQDALRDSDTAARMGGDEFVVVCPNVATQDELLEVRDRLHRCLTTSIEVDGTIVQVGASIGAALGHGDDAARDLLRAADEAMYRVKLAGRANVAPPTTV